MALIALNAVVVASSVMVPASGQPEIQKAIVLNKAQPFPKDTVKALRIAPVNVAVASNTVAQPVRQRFGGEVTNTQGQVLPGQRPKK